MMYGHTFLDAFQKNEILKKALFERRCMDSTRIQMFKSVYCQKRYLTSPFLQIFFTELEHRCVSTQINKVTLRTHACVDNFV